ncbi:hypothetical protein SpCBS45565_g04373 [Spizellomyces sp. 'palustris']|nr:hypothetical protein SpCBS45565_g04373 [Spizellomyces sp. 'palustris']
MSASTSAPRQRRPATESDGTDLITKASVSQPSVLPFPYNHVPWLHPVAFPLETETGIPICYVIDTMKGLTLVVCIFWMVRFAAWHNAAAVVYTAIHGTYGILWMTKSRMFPDPKWSARYPLWFSVVTVFMLAGYWIGPYNLMRSGKSAHPVVIFLAIAAWGLGVFLHFGSDLQKTIELEYRRRHPADKTGEGPGLITDRFFAYNRNPNYLGELLIYGSFLLLSRDLAAFALFAIIFLGFWIPNMMLKDQSISRYPEFAEYKRKTCFLIPFLW